MRSLYSVFITSFIVFSCKNETIKQKEVTIEPIPKDTLVKSGCFFYINEQDYIENNIIFQNGMNNQNQKVIYMKINGKIEQFDDHKKYFLNGDYSCSKTIYRNDYYEILLRTKEIESITASVGDENGEYCETTTTLEGSLTLTDRKTKIRKNLKIYGYCSS